MNTLLQEMSKQGISYREDSELCRSYLNGTLSPDFTADKVARVCALHKWLYSYTEYSAVCQQVLPSLASSLAPSLGGWDAAWEYVKQHEAPRIKAQVISSHGGVPQAWPWLKEQTSRT
ncbi:unnamed protein product [Chrysoparadoxa australica]